MNTDLNPSLTLGDVSSDKLRSDLADALEAVRELRTACDRLVQFDAQQPRSSPRHIPPHLLLACNDALAATARYEHGAD